MKVLMLLIVAAAGLSEVGVADEGISTSADGAIDTLWVLVGGSLVFLMQAGFAFLEAGLHSAKNCVHILMKNVGDFLIATVFFWAIGFGLMFGNGNDWIGLSGFFLEGGDAAFSSLAWAKGIPLEAKYFFQLVFAGTAATIVSGSIGGRFKFGTYIIFSLLMTTLLYPLLGHWSWGGGWLSNLGFYDFAGSTVVHQVGGWCALAGALLVGPRVGRFDNKIVNPYPPHNMPFVALGTFTLWLGWFGFNPASTMNITQSAGLVSHIFLTTNMGGVAGALSAMGISYLLTKKHDAGAMFNGLLSGLVAVTAGCAYVSARDSVIIGAVAGLIVIYGSILLEKLKIDDSVGAWPMHGLNGLWGTLAVGLFAQSPWAGGAGQPTVGLFYGGGFTQLGIQAVGAITVAVGAFAGGVSIFKLLDVTMGLRCSEREEVEGADLIEHGYKAYLGLELPPRNRRYVDQAITDSVIQLVHEEEKIPTRRRSTG